MALSPDPLDPLFDRWRDGAPPLRKPVNDEVWRRIEHAEMSRAGAGAWARIELACSRPAFAVAFVAACVLLGLFLAETRLSDAHARRNAELERSYLRLLDPRIESTAAMFTPASRQP